MSAEQILLKVSEFKGMGFRLSLQIDEKIMRRVILDCEKSFIENLGDFYSDLVLNENGKFDSALIILKNGIANIAFARLLTENANVSRFGGVKKQSDFSLRLQNYELEQEAGSYFEKGFSLLRDGFKEVLKVDDSKKVLAYPYYNFFRGYYEKDEI